MSKKEMHQRQTLQERVSGRRKSARQERQRTENNLEKETAYQNDFVQLHNNKNERNTQKDFK